MLALEKRNQFLSELIESSPYPVFVLSEKGKIISENLACIRFLQESSIDDVHLAELIQNTPRKIVLPTGIFRVIDADDDDGRLISLIPHVNLKGEQIIGENDVFSIAYFEEGKLEFINAKFQEQLGYGLRDIKKLNQIVNLVHNSDKDRYESLIQNVNEGTASEEVVLKLVTNKGKLKHFRVCISKDVNKFTGASYTLLRLSRYDSSELRFQYEDRFDLLLENTKDFLIIYEDDIIKHISESFANLGHDSQKVKTLKDVQNLVCEEDIGLLNRKVFEDRLARKKDSIYVFRIKQDNGNMLWYETTVRRTFHDDGKIKSLIGYYRDITEKKIAEDNNTASQQYLQKLTNAVTDALYVFNLDDFNYSFYNTSFEETLGYTPEELTLNDPKFLTEIVHPEDRSKVVDIRKILEQNNQSFHDVTIKIKGKDGDYKVLRSKLYPFTVESSAKNEVICFTQDVTEELEAQKEMSEIKTKYKLAVESSSSGAWEYRLEDKELFVDDKVKQMLGYGSSDPLDTLKRWEEKIYPDDYIQARKSIRDYVSQKTNDLEISYRIIHQTGAVKWVLTKGETINSSDSNTKVLGTHTDITDLKKYELALSASEEKFRNLAESLSDIFLALDKNLVFTYWNKACEKIFKVRSKDAMGKKMYEVLPYFAGSDIEKAILSSLIRQKVSTTMFKRKGSKHIYEVTTYPSKTGVSLFAKNVTHKIQYEEDLIASRRTAEEALKTKEEFMSVMSHEIRTPLNAIVGLTHLLLENSPKQDQIETLNTLKFSGDNLLVLVNDILDFSKIQAGKIELVDTVFDLHNLCKNLKNTYESQAKQKGVDLKMSLSKNPPRYVLGDKVRLTQILNNLLNNAIKFTEDGEVAIAVEKVKETDESVCVSFRISDSGIGIDPNDQLKIFDPFQQASKTTSRKFGGTGLGLSITKNLVELQGGSVELDSEVGKGSTFEIVLPFRKSTQQAHQKEVSKREIKNDYDDLQDIKLLYVDDVATNQFLMSGFCARWNIQLDKAMNGFEALDKVKEKEYDCILMDIQMPDIDGYETSKRIRKIKGEYYQNVPIIAYTAEVSESGKLDVDHAGMNDLLTKPVDPKELFRKINKYSGKTVKENKVKSKLKEDRLSISFSDLDDLYSDSTEAYLEVLTHLEYESKQNQKDLIRSIKEADVDLFNQSRHKMQTSLKIINYNTLISYLEDVKKDFKEDQVTIEKDDIVSKLSQYHDYLLKKVTSRKEELMTNSNESL